MVSSRVVKAFIPIRRNEHLWRQYSICDKENIRYGEHLWFIKYEDSLVIVVTNFSKLSLIE